MTDDIDTDDAHLFAAEYALGLLTPDEAAAFEVLLEEDAQVRAEYVQWATDFVAITDEIAPVTPPEGLLERIVQMIGAAPVSDAGFETIAVNEDVAEPRPAAPRRVGQDAPEPVVDKVQGWLQRLGLLPAMAGGLVAAMAVLWLINFSGVMAPDVPFATATLETEDQSLRVEIAYSDAGEGITFTRPVGAAPDGQVLQLWLIRDGSAPVSLGVLPDEETGTLVVAEAMRPLLRGASCAISVEPPGGSPTGAPSDIVATALIVWET